MNLLERYLLTHILYSGAVVLAILVILFSFLGLTEELEDVGKGAFTTADALSVVVLTTPSRIIELLPVTTLLGAVIGLGLLANHRELLAMRTAGISAWRFARTLAMLATALACSALVLQAALVPPAERKAQEFRTKQLAKTAIGATEFWSRHEQRFIRVGAVDLGRIPRDIEIYELGQRGRLEHLLLADRADVLNAREWQLYGVKEKRLDAVAVRYRELDTLVWQSFLTPEQLATLIAPAHAVATLDLYRYIDEMRGSGVDTREYQSILWQQLSLPVAVYAMALLGLPFALGAVRTRSTGLRTVVGLVIGIAFYLGEQISGHLAQLYELPPAPSALAPSLVVLLAALLAIRRVG